jgi:hypothetical protein
MIAPPQMAGADWEHDLVIGCGFLRHYIVTFDYPGKLVTPQAPGRAAATSVVRTSRLSVATAAGSLWGIRRLRG